MVGIEAKCSIRVERVGGKRFRYWSVGLDKKKYGKIIWHWEICPYIIPEKSIKFVRLICLNLRTAVGSIVTTRFKSSS